MKLFAVLVSMIVGSVAFAAEDKCVLNVTDASGTTTTTLVEMELRQNPRADIPGYILDITHEGFKVFVSEADGNFWGRLTAPSGAYSEGEAHDASLSLSVVEGDKALYMECF